jgi:hypothetical protein
MYHLTNSVGLGHRTGSESQVLKLTYYNTANEYLKKVLYTFFLFYRLGGWARLQHIVPTVS